MVEVEEQAWVSTERGNHLRGRVTRNTRPEIALRKAVHALGLRFRLHRAVAPRCTPDFILPRWHVAVFVDGCYWHGCPQHGVREFRGPNAQLWREKITANQARDSRNTRAAQDAGWLVIRIWECEVRKDPGAAAQRVRSAALGQEASSDATASDQKSWERD
ncbi:very short patch repair endonuclease [Kitasatospora sp. NPDC048194]|uniref:very short patch repair endonuclease n=1 Tax=Kitasatospora sp. NPDC048194 TaxID=3364045 RepID=UPI00372114F7